MAAGAGSARDPWAGLHTLEDRPLVCSSRKRMLTISRVAVLAQVLSSLDFPSFCADFFDLVLVLGSNPFILVPPPSLQTVDADVVNPVMGQAGGILESPLSRNQLGSFPNSDSRI